MSATVKPIPWVARILTADRRDWLTRPRNHLLLTLLSVLLCSASLNLGLQLDDHSHRLVAHANDTARSVVTTPPHRFDLFNFFSGDALTLQEFHEVGVAPWYASSHLRLAFARPLSSATHVLDYTLLDSWPWAMHLQSLCWLFLLGLAVSRLVRRLEGGWIAGLIILFYVLDSGHGTPAGWLANRNQLIAGVFGALALDAHIRWRQRELRTPMLALALALLSLLAGESMIAWAAFHLAFAVTLDPVGKRQGLIALAPLASLIILWRIVYRWLGYGASGSGFYIDPLGDPLQFIRVAPERLLQLLADQLGGAPAGIGMLGGRDFELAFIAIAGVVVAISIAAIAPLWRSDRVLRFWAIGALLAVIPMCATVPNGRLMVVAGLGVCGVVARYIANLIEHHHIHQAKGLLAAFWLIALGVLSPLQLPFEARIMGVFGQPQKHAVQSVPPSAAGRTLVVVSVPDLIFMCNQLPIVLLTENRPTPKRIRCLAGVDGDIVVKREDEHTLLLHTPQGLLSGFLAPLFRSPTNPLDKTWSLKLSDVFMEIAEFDQDSKPVALRVRFHTPLSDPSRTFVAWSPSVYAFVPFDPPAIGQATMIRGQRFVDLLMGK